MKHFLTFATLIMMSAAVWAGDLTAYNKATFDQALKDGKPIVAQFHATWCPTCKKQEASLKAIYSPDKLKGVTIFKVDYDNESDLKAQYHVTNQSTVLIFNKGKEVSRVTGVTDQAELEQIIKKGAGI